MVTGDLKFVPATANIYPVPCRGQMLISFPGYIYLKYFSVWLCIWRANAYLYSLLVYWQYVIRGLKKKSVFWTSQLCFIFQWVFLYPHLSFMLHVLVLLFSCLFWWAEDNFPLWRTLFFDVVNFGLGQLTYIHFYSTFQHVHCLKWPP